MEDAAGGFARLAHRGTPVIINADRRGRMEAARGAEQQLHAVSSGRTRDGRGGDLDEQRISRMYWNLAVQRVARMWHGVTGSDGRGSSVFPLLAIVLVLLVPSAIWVAHRHAKFHSLEQKIQGVQQQTGPRPGGRDAIVLTRKASAGASAPEFLSVTLLPGLGMDVLQITASLPGKGEVPLLVAPTVQQVADAMDQAGGDTNDLHGALELPWSGSMEGLPSPLGTTQMESWKGRTVTTPTDVGGQPGLVKGGLLRLMDADDAQMGPDGLRAQATFGATDFDEHWFSKTSAAVHVTMQPTAIELVIDAKNVGDQPEPLGIGWHPRFAIMGGRRGEISIRLPRAERLEYSDKIRHTPSGKIVPAGSGLEALMGHLGVLGEAGLDEALVKLTPGGDGGGAFAEMRDAQGGYGLRITGMSQNNKEMKVFAPADQSFVGLGMQTNYDDPLARMWTGDEAIEALGPGDSVEWKVRLEIFPVSAKTR